MTQLSTSANTIAVTNELGGDSIDLRAVTDALPALVSFYDRNHVCRFANRYHREWYGRHPEDLVGLHLREIIGNEYYERRVEHFDRAAGGEEVAFEALVPHARDGAREASIRLIPRRTPDGAVDGVYVLVFDVELYQTRFRGIFDAMAVAFWQIDFGVLAMRIAELAASGITDFRGYIAANPGFIREALEQTLALEVNDKAVEMFGAASKDELLGPVSRFWPRESEEAFAGSVLASIERRGHFEAETRFARVDGSVFDGLLTCAFPKGVGKRPVFTVGITDISGRIAANDALTRARDDLTHAARIASLGELTASIAHEVNQPLAAIVTNGEAGLRWLNRPEPDLGEARLAMERMIDEARRASQVIAGVRSMARKGERTHALFCPNLMVEDAVRLLRREIDRRAVRLALDLASGLPEIDADRIQLQQVVVNLMSNAAQAMEDVPEDRRDLRVRTMRDDAHLVVEVIDTGPGIAPDKAAQLFDAFVTSKASGLGLGLSISRSIVESHGGAIAALPTPGGGATFRFSVPIRPIA